METLSTVEIGKYLVEVKQNKNIDDNYVFLYYNGGVKVEMDRSQKLTLNGAIRLAEDMITWLKAKPTE